MMEQKEINFEIESLGECKIKSPLMAIPGIHESVFVDDDTRMNVNLFVKHGQSPEGPTMEVAGPRKKIFFDPSEVTSAIVTCGGLCPGLNDVIRSIVMESTYRYGSRSIFGIRYGYNGLNPDNNFEPILLTPQVVEDIHLNGGTILGSSRGGTDDIALLVNTLQSMEIRILYAIGGDGTLRGAHAIHEEAKKRGYKMAVVGIPKTIDNDISYIQRSFGFETAFSEAVKAIQSAHVEAKGAPHGIGLVKLMGRHSGFIAANATLAMNDVNYVLIPEAKFCLEGEDGFLQHLEDRLKKRSHAVVCVAEGAGQDLLIEDMSTAERDASGNLKLADIGIFLKKKITEYFTERNMEVNLKYIDPSYIIRSAPAVPNDSVFCTLLGQLAVHAGMAGKTDIVIGQWNNIYTNIPIEVAISRRKSIDPHSSFWNSVLEATGQPSFESCS